MVEAVDGVIAVAVDILNDFFTAREVDDIIALPAVDGDARSAIMLDDDIIARASVDDDFDGAVIFNDIIAVVAV